MLTEEERKDARRHFNFYRGRWPEKDARSATRGALKIWKGSYPRASNDKIVEVESYLRELAEKKSARAVQYS